MKSFSLSVLFIAIALFVPEPSLAASSSIVCVNSRGTFTVRAKCAKGESRLSAGKLVAMGFNTAQDFSINACKVATNSSSTTNGAIIVTTACTSNEYLLTWGFVFDHGQTYSLPFVRESWLNFDGNIPMSISVAMQTESEASAMGTNYTSYTLYVTAVCCKR